MKCKYCNAEIEQDAQFCPNCGKDLSKFNKCVKCGELLDNDTVFCSYCGTEQPHEEKAEAEKSSSKKWLLALPLIVLLIGAGVWYFYSDGFSFGEKPINAQEEIAESDTVEIKTDIQSVDGITSRLYEIYINGLKLQDDEAVNKYFSEEFRALYKKVDEIVSNSGEMGFWEGNIWDGGQDGNPTDVEIMRVDKSSPTVALADVKLSYHNGDYHSNQKLSMTLVFENGNWFIDENNEMRFKERMKEYVNENANSNDSPTSFVNKIYKGSGNGGGIGTKMTISFLDNNKCLCESDWYQAFSSPKTYQGTYSIDGDKLLVRCKVDDTEYEFKFDVKSNGRVIEFNNSDPDVGGTMGNDIMSLELQ